MDEYIRELNTRVEDPNMPRKSEMTEKVQFVDGIPLPSVVEISNSGTCNRKCAFCPRSAPDFPDVKEFIDDRFVHTIGKQLGKLDYSGMILFSGFVEPLLDVNISRHIRYLADQAPRAHIEMISNGDPITISNLNKLADSGLSMLLVSLYDGPHQVDEIKEMVERSRYGADKIGYRKRWFGEDENFGISLSNRSGMMRGAEFSIADLERPLTSPCYYPSHTFFIDYDGDVLLCAHDWGKKAVAGNIFNDSMLDIWTGPLFSKSRQGLIEGDRNFSPCNVCNVDGTRTGGHHAKAWKSAS